MFKVICLCISLLFLFKAGRWTPDRPLPIEKGQMNNLAINHGRNGYHIHFDLLDSMHQLIQETTFKTYNHLSMEKLKIMKEIKFNYIDEKKNIYFPDLPADVSVVELPYRAKRLRDRQQNKKTVCKERETA